MIDIDLYIPAFRTTFLQDTPLQPWELIEDLDRILSQHLKLLNAGYRIENDMAIHKTAVIEQGVVINGKIIVSANCFVGANAYLRGPVFLGNAVKVGPSSEIKQSIIFDNTAMAHLNYIGNSVIGQDVNFEAGSICANHYNERTDKRIFVKYKGQLIDTMTQKFGSLVGDHAKIGANAVLSPGTILEKYHIVKRLELIEQT